MSLQDFEIVALQDPDVFKGFLSRMTTEEFQSARNFIEKAVLKDKRSMVALGSQVIAEIGIGKSVKYSEDFLVSMFREASKPLPKTLKWVWEKEAFIDHHDLASAIIEIARQNGDSWWQRMKLRVGMRKEFDWA